MIPLIRETVLFKILVFSHLELKGIKVYIDNIRDQIMMDVEILYVILYFFFLLNKIFFLVRLLIYVL
jgi:hypothetical protein